MRRLSGLVMALAAASCAVPTEPAAGERLTLALVGGWSAEERAAIEASLDAWRVTTGGDVNVHATDEPRAADARLVRGPVASRVSDFSRLERWIRIDADALAAEGFSARDGVGALTGCLVGRMLGMPFHDGDRGFLSSTNITADPTADDVAACRAAGMCE